MVNLIKPEFVELKISTNLYRRPSLHCESAHNSIRSPCIVDLPIGLKYQSLIILVSI